jgi:hypothetical protein
MNMYISSSNIGMCQKIINRFKFYKFKIFILNK